MKKLSALALSLLLVGCSSGSAQKAANVIQGILNVAAAEVNVVPPADQAAYKNYVALAQTLENQLQSCVQSVNAVSMTKSSKFLACFTTFASGLSSSQELTALRLVSSGTQNKVQLYLTAILTGVNVAITAYGGTAVPTPAIGSAPSAQQLHSLAHQIGL